MKKYTKLFSLLLVVVILVGNILCSVDSLAATKGTLGDINGDNKINVIDANLIRRHCAHLITLTEDQLANADVNGDGSVNIVDANILRRYSAELISTLPAAGVKFTVTFMNYDWTVLKTEEVLCGQAATPPTVPARDGHTFTGWNGEYTNITGDVILVAQFTETVVGGNYTVTFEDYDGRVILSQSVVSGKSASLPMNPTRTGFVFVGWNGTYQNVYANSTVTATYVEEDAYNLFILESATAAKGDTISLMFELSGTVKMCDFDIRIMFDNEALEYVSFDADQDLDITSNYIAADSLIILNYSNASNKTKQRDIIELIFKVKDDAIVTDTVIDITANKVECINEQEQLVAVDYTLIDAIIRIS